MYSSLVVRVLKIGALALVVAGVVIAGVSWSWTHTPLGRLDYVPAVMAKLASWGSSEPDMTPESRARNNEMVRGMMGDPVPLARIEDREVQAGGVAIPVRIYWPDAPGPLPMLLDIHGGGFWMGDGFPFHAATTRLAESADVIVVSVDYRLAPEHPYPAALDDCHAVLEWMYANAAELGGDPARIAVGGGSAGGNLAAAVALRARDRGGPPIAFQVLNIPVTDLSGTIAWPSHEETGDDYVLTVSGLATMYAAYAPDPRDRLDPYVSPYLAEDLSGLPPALVVTAHFDPLRDEGEAYARRLREAGVPATLHREPGALHGFMGSPDRMARVQAMVASALRDALHP